MEFPAPEKAERQRTEREALAMAGALEESLKEHTHALAEVSRWKAKVAKWALAAGIAAVLAFGAFGYTLYEIHSSQVDACHIANAARLANVRLWDHIIEVSKPPPGETPAQKAQRLATIKSFREYVHNAFRPLDCSEIYGSWGRWLY